MSSTTVTLEAPPGKRGSAKTRIFSVHLLGFLTADSLWTSGGDGSVQRPIWLAFFGSESETRPFTANLRAGRRARAGGDLLELPVGAHRWVPPQKVPTGVISVAYLPELFDLEPGSGPLADPVRFVFAPPRWWVDKEAADLASEFGEDAPEAARAALFCAFLDRRCPIPLVHDLHFHLQVYRAALESFWVYPLSDPAGGPPSAAAEPRPQASTLPLPVASTRRFWPTF